MLRTTALLGALGAIALPGTVAADTRILVGLIIDEVWNAAGSPYRIEGDIVVPEGASLRIEGGVLVELADCCFERPCDADPICELGSYVEW